MGAVVMDYAEAARVFPIPREPALLNTGSWEIQELAMIRDKLTALRRQRAMVQREVDRLTVEIEAEERLVDRAYDCARVQSQYTFLEDYDNG